MAYIVLLIGLGAFLYFGVWTLKRVEPTTRRKLFMTLGLVISLLVLFFLAISGRLIWAAGLIIFWLPWILKGWQFRQFLKRAQAYQNKTRKSDHRKSETMSQEEALKILGLSDNASQEEIQKAHRQLIRRLHSDITGSDYLASLINQAREILKK